MRTARSKGLTQRVIRGRHILRNALLPVVTIIGLQVGGLFAGAVLTETVFNFGGIGEALANAFTLRDYSVLQVIILAAAITYVIVNLLVDIAYAIWPGSPPNWARRWRVLKAGRAATPPGMSASTAASGSCSAGIGRSCGSSRRRRRSRPHGRGCRRHRGRRRAVIVRQRVGAAAARQGVSRRRRHHPDLRAARALRPPHRAP